jgi:hypothetical protein|nr:MAG TPA_asm: hypothetical protein [Caudoviricetes sp.]
MEHPSQAWLDKFNDTLVPEEFVEISYDSTEPGVQEDATASATAQVPFGNIENTTKELDRVLTKYATGETNLHVLDGSFRLLPDSVPYADAGFISQTLVSDSSHPRIILSFGRVHTRAVPGLTIVWSSMMNEWATKFKLTAYKGTNVVSTITVSNNRSVYSETEWEIYGYDSIAIDILEWSIPNRRARIEWIMVGFHKVYNKKDLVSYTHTSSRDPISAQLPKDSIEFSLDNSQKTWDAINPRGMFRYLYERQEVDVRYGMDVDGETQWINGGKFYLSEWSVPSNGLEASFTARDALEFMMTSNYTGRKTGTLYQMCYDALETLPSNVPSFYISEELKEYSTDISSEKNSYKNSDILQLAANAAGMALYQTRDGHIRIERVNLTAEEGTEVYEIPVINNFQWPEISFASRVKNVSCNVNGKEHLYPEGSNAEGVTQTVSNELLTEAMLVKSKNSITEAYAMLANRKKVELEYRASPHIDAFDHVKFNHNFGYASSVFVTESKYQYTGCFKGTISGYVLADVSSVSLSPSSLSLIYNEPKVLTAELLPYDPDLPTVSWRALPEGIVTLRVLTNESGKSTCEVKYNRKGNATVSAYVGSVSSSIPVINNSPSLYLSTRALGVRWGASQDITATFTPNNYGAPEINWSASPSDVVQLDIVAKSNGSSTCRVTWLRKGNATITVTAAEERLTCAVTAYASTLDTIPEGSEIQIKENDTWVSFILAKHNYEPARNGNGRNLIVRKVRCDDKVVWNESNVQQYKDSTVDKWLNDTYYSRFSYSVRNKIQSTNIQYTEGITGYYWDEPTGGSWNQYQMSRKVFLLSMAEYGIFAKYPNWTKHFCIEGSPIPNYIQIAAFNTSNMKQFVRTRTPAKYLGEEWWGEGSGQWTNYSYAVVQEYIGTIAGYADSESGLSADGVQCNVAWYVAPAFTFPNDVEVDANGRIML